MKTYIHIKHIHIDIGAITLSLLNTVLMKFSIPDIMIQKLLVLFMCVYYNSNDFALMIAEKTVRDVNKVNKLLPDFNNMVDILSSKLYMTFIYHKNMHIKCAQFCIFRVTYKGK